MRRRLPGTGTAFTSGRPTSILFGSHVVRCNGLPLETIDVDVVPARLSDDLSHLAEAAKLGGTGSGKTTLARELAVTPHVPHVELDSLYFGPELSTAPLLLLRERTSAATRR